MFVHLWKGFNQLTTRYSIGDYNQKDGGLLIYIRQANTKSIIEKWKEYLSAKNLINYQFKACIKRPLAFFTIHRHESSGEDFRVRHMPVILHFEPQDNR